MHTLRIFHIIKKRVHTIYRFYLFTFQYTHSISAGLCSKEYEKIKKNNSLSPNLSDISLTFQFIWTEALSRIITLSSLHQEKTCQ